MAENHLPNGLTACMRPRPAGLFCSGSAGLSTVYMVIAGPVGAGVSELRIFLGPGYRVYFGEEADHMVVLLCGGVKDSQRRDINAAREYWKDYQANGKA